MRILIVKTSSMGDIVHALPAAADIAENIPGAEIDWVVEESFRDIPRLSVCVGGFIETAFRRWRKTPFSREVRSEVRDVRKRLSGGRYDIVIDLQGLMRSGLVVHWSGVGRAAGYSFSTVRERAAALAYSPDLRFPFPASMGAVNRCRALAAAALGYEVKGPPRFRLRADAPNPVSAGAPYAALLVNTSQDRKLWDGKNWIAVGRFLAEERGLKSVLFWGSGRERARVERIAAGIGGAVVADRMSLASAASALAGSSAAVGLDTGLTHLAAALGVPTLGIFPDSPLERVGLVGEGQCVTLGGKGMTPSLNEVLDWCRSGAK